MTEGSTRIQTLSLLGSYPPRLCGVATFTKDLRDALAAEMSGGSVAVLAMDDAPGEYDYPDEVRFQIPQHQLSEYRTAADLLNINQIDGVIVQHEFGLYGGRDGAYLINLIKRLRMPVLTTLHTILSNPSRGQYAVMRDLIRYSDRLVVMSHLAGRIVTDTYKVPPEKVIYIPHGMPDVPFVDPHYFKDQFGVEARTVLLTFGLLSPGKGIEVAIKALPRIVKRHPDVIYIVLGATHPHVLRQQGNAYRHSLEQLVFKLGLSDHVEFHNRFVSLEELCRYIGAADVYITPYPNKEQVTSGTLTYALGMGKAVVSTPYWHAEELLADGRGRLFDFNNSEMLADVVNELLENEVERHAMRKRAYTDCRPMVWSQVARSYIEAMKRVVSTRQEKPRPVHYLASEPRELAAVPEVNLAHLRRLTDCTGIFQHAIYSTPNRHHGYCTDDNSRALVTALMHFDLHHDESVLPLTDVYLSFLHYAFNPETRRFRNFMSYDRRWTEDAGSEDVHGRAIWALGLATAWGPNDGVISFATRLFNSALEPLENFGAPRSWAFALVGIHAYLQRFAGDTNARRVRMHLARRLFEMFESHRGDGWPWCEDVVTYDNAKLPHALILSGQWIPDGAMLEQGLRSLEWLIQLQFREERNVSLIGNQGWLRRDGQRARFDQQPIEAMALIEACAEAYRCTQDHLWVERAEQALGWFLGNNDTRSLLYDYATGGCRDGLHADGPNLNQGAESTLAWLISALTVLALRPTEEGAVAASPVAGAVVKPVVDQPVQSAQ